MPREDRVVFVSLPVGGRQHSAWVEHHRSVLGETELSTGGVDIVFAWQLVTVNGRSICRAGDFSASMDDALDGLAAIRARSTALQIASTIRPHDHLYGWSGRIDGRVALVGARWYSSIRDNRSAADLAIRSLATARIITGRTTDTLPLDLSEVSRSRTAPVHLGAEGHSHSASTLGES